MANKFYFTGKLILSNNLTINYGVYNKPLTTFDSLTDILNNIYKSDNPLVRIKLIQISNGRTLDKMGKLYIDKDEYGVSGFHVNSLPLDLYLDEIVGEQIEIFIEDFITEVSEDLIRNEDAKSFVS